MDFKTLLYYYFMYDMSLYFIYKSFNLLAFLWYCYPLYALLFLILRLATGSGYENFRSLAPVMTPQFGSWQSWYQSLGLELYHLGYLNGVTVV